MVEPLPPCGTDRCLACDSTPTVPAHVALDGQLCRTCLAAVPGRFTRLARPSGAAGAWALTDDAQPLAGMVAACRARGDEALLWALGRHCGWVDGLPVPDGVAALPASPWSRVARGVSPHDVVACSLAAFLGLPLLAPFLVRRGHASGPGPRERVAPLGGVEGRVLLVADTLPGEDRLALYVARLHDAGADEVHVLAVTARGHHGAVHARPVAMPPVTARSRGRARPAAPDSRVRVPVLTVR